MCEFCIKHGEGKKWYLNAKNYSEELFDHARKDYMKKFYKGLKRTYERNLKWARKLPVNAPVIGSLIKALIKRVRINNHWGQAVPIEDVEKILSMTNSIVRIPCSCYRIMSGKEIRKCFVLTLSPENIEFGEKFYFGEPDVIKFEKVEKIDALNFMREQEREGAFHSIWTFKTPFILSICNCRSTECIAMDAYRDVMPTFFKAEYVADIDIDECNGCGACAKVCPFDALCFDPGDRKMTVNNDKCYGCGICRSVCVKNAITLRDRQSNVRHPVI